MDGQDRRPLPAEPLEARQRAEELLGCAVDEKGLPPADLDDAALGEPYLRVATAWALLAIAGELHEIRKQLRKSGR